MSVALECYSTRLPKEVKRNIKVLAALKGCTQQELIEGMVHEELSRCKGDKAYGK